MHTTDDLTPSSLSHRPTTPLTMVTVVQALAVLGVVLSLQYVYRFAAFVWLYFLRSTTIHHYLHGPAPVYALVTGATDGIGKATAGELWDRGFNLILHGRNEKKMQRVIEELRARGNRAGKGDIQYFLADVTKPGHDFEKLAAPFKELNITFVVHNVGGSTGVQPERLDERPEEYIHSLVNWNALFPLLLSRVLLPQLRRSAAHGPVLVQFVGSLAGDVCPARLPIYASSKRFLEALARGMDTDERYFDAPTGVRFAYLAVGPVHSNSMPQAPSLNTPTSETFAKAIVATAGCGYRRYAPYAMHSIAKTVVAALGERVVDYYTAREMKTLIETFAKSQ
ncbi:NAD-P-binding protein [Trametes elegans]|nr:NAD-P-binding protein [Trametes elegans]